MSSGATLGFAFKTFETVAGETPARSATVLIETGGLRFNVLSWRCQASRKTFYEKLDFPFERVNIAPVSTFWGG
jgi:hypothetical protein